MYYTGLDPFTGKPVHIARKLRERKLQRALMQFFKPGNYFGVRKALIEAGRPNEAAELWWDDRRARAFAAELRRFGDFLTNIAAPQRIEGAAGSLYVEIALQLLQRGFEILRNHALH